MKKADNFDPSKWLVENKITTQSRLNENKIPGVNVDNDGEQITLSGDSGDYDGFIEDDGTVSFTVTSDEEEFDDNNWKSILGKKHVFVKIANAIPTEVEALDDYVMITVKASDLTSMNESNLNKDESPQPLRIGSTITPDMWKPEQQVLGDWKATPFFYKMKWTIVKIAKDYVTDEDDIKELVVSLDSKDYEDMIPLVDLNNALKKEYQIKK